MAQKSNRKGKPMGQLLGEGFFAMHPFENVFFHTDQYYNGIVRKILPMLEPMRSNLDCSEPILRRTALCIAAYFEDQVSQLGLWSAFIHRHRELYGRWLPWYDTSEDYYEDEVNLQDVKFLLWMINVSTEDEVYTTPDDPTIEECAQEIFDFLVDEFESAPINEQLVSLLYKDTLTDDFYTMKNIFIWMTKTCYLMAVPKPEMEVRNSILDSVRQMTEGNQDERALSYIAKSYICMRMRVGPLALYPKDWYVLMRQQRGITKDNDKIMEIETTPFYPFLIVSNNGQTLTMRSCRGVEYEVEIQSFKDPVAKRTRAGQFVLTSLVKYNGRWGANGMTIFLGKEDSRSSFKSDEEVLKEQASDLQRNGQPIDLFSQPDKSVPSSMPQEMRERLDRAIAENNGNRLFYFSNFKEALKWQEVEIFKKSFDYNRSGSEAMGDTHVVLYVSENYSVLLFSLAYTINDPSNPYFDPDEAYMGNQWLYDKFGIANELVAYLVQHKYLTDLSFNEQEPQPQYSGLIEENLPFWASFMRQYPC